MLLCFVSHMGTTPMGKPVFTRQMTEAEFEGQSATDDACKAYLVARRWPAGVRCPRCNNDKVWELKARPFHWQCNKCGPRDYRFSVMVGTVFENTNVPMRQWFKVIYLMLTSKKGISALQVHRMMGFDSYQTAHYMCHRIRVGLIDPDFCKLLGIVEVDETNIGGKNKIRHWDTKIPGTGSAGKEIVIGAVDRQGNVVARVLREANMNTMGHFVRDVVADRVSLIATDGHSGYLGLGPKLPHDRAALTIAREPPATQRPQPTKAAPHRLATTDTASPTSNQRSALSERSKTDQQHLTNALSALACFSSLGCLGASLFIGYRLGPVINYPVSVGRRHQDTVLVR
jgi:hypothetical protein